MIISCPECSTRYVVPESAIGVDGRTVRCAKCKHSWFQGPEPLELDEPAPGEAGVSQDEPTAPPAAEPEPAPEPAPEPEPAQESKPEPEDNPQDQAPDPNAAPSVSHWRTSDQPDSVSGEPSHTDDDEASETADASDAQAIESAEQAAQDPPAEAEVDQSDADEQSDEAAHQDSLAEPEATTDEVEPFEDGVDPLAGEGSHETYDDADYDFDEDGYDDGGSTFAYSPPFSQRRNPLKMWTIAAVIFALLATGTAVAVNYYGLPNWLPIAQPTFGIGQDDLTLDFPNDQQRPEVLENGEEIFRVRGSIRNTGTETTSVPSLLIVFRDERERNVGNWVVVPSKRELAPGESLNVTEAVTDIPPSARAAEIGWSPN